MLSTLFSDAKVVYKAEKLVLQSMSYRKMKGPQQDPLHKEKISRLPAYDFRINNGKKTVNFVAGGVFMCEE